VWEVISAIAAGKLPPPGAVVGAGDKALCDVCPRKKGEKRLTEFKSIATFVPDTETCLLEQGVICCGPATRSGCGERCVNANMPCCGCYGPPPGVEDQGSKMLSTVASAIDSEDPAAIERIIDRIQDPVGVFFRFSMPSSPFSGATEMNADEAHHD
jgi:F420-non-reducing hydrogenase small subunit